MDGETTRWDGGGDSKVTRAGASMQGRGSTGSGEINGRAAAGRGGGKAAVGGAGRAPAEGWRRWMARQDRRVSEQRRTMSGGCGWLGSVRAWREDGSSEGRVGFRGARSGNVLKSPGNGKKTPGLTSFRTKTYESRFPRLTKGGGNEFSGGRDGRWEACGRPWISPAQRACEAAPCELRSCTCQIGRACGESIAWYRVLIR